MLIDLRRDAVRRWRCPHTPATSRQERKNATRAQLSRMTVEEIRSFARERSISLDGSDDRRDLVLQVMSQYGMWAL